MRLHELDFAKFLAGKEASVLAELARAYAQALADVRQQLSVLESRSQTQSVFHQIRFKQAQERQLLATVRALRDREIKTISEYQKFMHQNGFIAVSQGLNADGVALVIPIDPNVTASSLMNQVQGLNFADRIGIQMADFHNSIARAINSGIARGATFAEITREIVRVAESRLNFAYRIAITEGNRVLNQAKWQAMREAERRGAEVMKQWHSALLTTTRDTHADMHGQLREIDDWFENLNGDRALHPLGFGIAAEDINCHCTLLQRARWALAAEQVDELAKVEGMDELMKAEDYAEYREVYNAKADEVAQRQAEILEEEK